MPRIKKQTDEERSAFDMYRLNPKQLKLFEAELEKYDSEEAFFLGIKAIKIKNEQVYIMQYDGLKGTIDKVTGASFPTDIPYHFYRKCLDQLIEHDSKVQYAIKKQSEVVEQLAMETEVIINDVDF